MKHQFITNSQNPSDGLFDAGDEIGSSFLPAASDHSGNPPAHDPLPPALVLSSEAVEAEAAQSGPVTVTAVTSGGITINLLYDAAAMAAPQSFRNGIQQAVSLLTAAISDKITVNIQIDYSGTGGGAAAGPDNGQFESYSSVKADLINNATPGDTTFNGLPTGSSIQGQSSVVLWNAQLKLYGLLGANDTTTDDGSATFATDINPSLLVGVALHELTHALGRIPYGPQPDVFDLYRFTGAGARLFTDNIPASAAYFSVDGGTTKLADYGRNSDPSDFLNSGVQGSNDPFNEFYSGSTLQTLTAMDLRQLDALGFHTMAPVQQTIVVAAAATQAVQGGVAVTLLSGPPVITDSASTTLSSATIKITNTSGSAVAGDKLFVNGVQNGSVGSGVTASWNAATDTFTLTGSATLAAYDTLLSEVSYQDTGTDSSTGSHPTRTVTWTVNDATAALSTTSQIAIERAPVASVANVALNGFAPVAASSLLTASDPDSDAIATYAFKDTGNGHFVLNGVVQANNQEIDVTAAQLSQLTYQSTGGVDSLQIRVNDGTLWSAWQSFTVTGPAGTAIESLGSTSLVQLSNDYYFDSNITGSGPQLKYNGALVTAGQTSIWTPIGAEQTVTGYEVAWKVAGADQYMIWNTDSNGNYVSSFQSNGVAMESYETSFHQDLNGDGVIGVSGGVIESFGSTSLIQVSNGYFLDTTSTSSGPQLKYNGALVTAGQTGIWTPIGAEQTATGYEVAWKMSSVDQYMIWNTDSNGNYVSSLQGNGVAVESYETSFHQDLNGDGVIGISGTVIESFGSTSLVQVSNSYFLDTTSTSSGPQLNYNGALVTAGQTGIWTSIGAEQTATGYEVAWKVAGADRYMVWNTDNNGNYVSSLQGNGVAMQTYETTFHQDLNGDGVIGVPAAQTPLASNTAPPSNLPPSTEQEPISGTTITATAPNQTLTGTGSNDNFVFAAAPGHATITNFQPVNDVIQIDHSVFANVQALLSASQDDGHGNVVITADANDTITLQHVTLAQLLAHQGDFHIA